jgi:hypothetical protein
MMTPCMNRLYEGAHFLINKEGPRVPIATLAFSFLLSFLENSFLLSLRRKPHGRQQRQEMQAGADSPPDSFNESE